MFCMQLKQAILLCIIVTITMAEIVSAASTGRSRAEQIDYQEFKSIISPNYSVRHVNPLHCDPNVTQV
jgi:hypothetical protein